MKQYLIATLMIIGTLQAQAQSWAEWFKQNKTQRKYLVQQVAGLQVYIQFAQQGYSIARSGLTAISDLKNGDLNLHSMFFSGLRSVHPAIQKYAQLPELLAMELRIRSLGTKSINKLHRSGAFEPDEMDYAQRVLQRLKLDGTRILEESLLLLSDGHYQLSEDQRLKKLYELRQQLEENLSFCKAFTDELDLMGIYRNQENQSIQSIRRISGLTLVP